MIEIPFTKLHGAGNDFLLTWRHEAPQTGLAEIARRMCMRTTGIGADGWMLVWLQDGDLHTRLFNSDGGEAEISGNGTRCAAGVRTFEGSGLSSTDLRGHRRRKKGASAIVPVTQRLSL